MMSLDTMFGPAIAPILRPNGTAIDPWERTFQPSSLQELDANTSATLKALLDAVSNDSKVSSRLTYDNVILWIVDPGGAIWFSVEELVFAGTPTGHARLKRLLALMPKLGHPSMVKCGPARIAGEIYYDKGLAPGKWVINNLSGRYSADRSRERAHLINVANEFLSHGISLHIDWL